MNAHDSLPSQSNLKETDIRGEWDSYDKCTCSFSPVTYTHFPMYTKHVQPRLKWRLQGWKWDWTWFANDMSEWKTILRKWSKHGRPYRTLNKQTRGVEIGLYHRIMVPNPWFCSLLDCFEAPYLDAMWNPGSSWSFPFHYIIGIHTDPTCFQEVFFILNGDSLPHVAIPRTCCGAHPLQSLPRGINHSPENLVPSSWFFAKAWRHDAIFARASSRTLWWNHEIGKGVVTRPWAETTKFPGGCQSNQTCQKLHLDLAIKRNWWKL